MRFTSGSILFIVACCFIATLVDPKDSFAIPAFSRQFKTECFTCHTIFPELTDQGDNFRRNSFVWIGTKAAATRAGGKTEGSKAPTVPEYLVVSSLPEYVPLSVVGTLNASYANYRLSGQGNKFDLALRDIVLDAGGSLNDKLGAWISYNLYTEGPFDHVSGSSTLNGNVPSNNKPDVNEAFAQARHLFATPVNVKVGRFTPTLSLWKATNKTSIVSPMATTSYRTGASPFFVNAATDGVEANSILHGRWAVAAGIAKIKDQKNPSGYGSIQYRFGGADFEGYEAPVDMAAEESFLDYLVVTLGGYGYVGSNNPGTLRQLNDFYRYGFEGDLRYQKLRVKLASAFGGDNGPFVTDGGAQGTQPEIRSQVFAAEALYFIGSQFIPSLRLEYEDNGAFISRRVIPTLAYAPLQNAKLVLEYKFERVSGRHSDDSTVNLALTAAF